MLTSSRVGLLEPCDNACARNRYLIVILSWIAMSCGLSSVSSAQPIELQEVLSIGGFFDIADIAVGQDGNIYVADHRDFSISKYDSHGQLISRVGHQGVAPGEFVSGPHSIALLDSTLVATDQVGTGAVRFFDLDLNYTGSAQITLASNIDPAPNQLLYYGTVDLADVTTLKSYIGAYALNGEISSMFELRDMHKYNTENQFILLVGPLGRIVVVFQAVNRIDVYDLSGNVLNRLSVADLPLRYEGGFIDLEGQIPLPDHMIESISYVPGGMIFTGAVLDHAGNLLLEHGGEIEEMPVRRSVYVMTLAGEEKGVFKMPPYTRLVYMDRKGFAYAVTTTDSTDFLRKYKLEYLE
ncbi:MAG: hypothetical protein F4065_07790 [Rhodothermaceae bacterium]|nr:hypothetical protein [Bacteroidota bacterium]MXX96481.1 hypothetical protein [Rhodothermaceae bacterium]MXZ59153.1 hypothetical protein [Rhodothermaceae bacterium]MYB90269.1 hypothetical protein [Rhodothermaceae bacterium]MYD68555.1 hypothetical protein [Rhodothermaceae bacterium]